MLGRRGLTSPASPFIFAAAARSRLSRERRSCCADSSGASRFEKYNQAAMTALTTVTRAGKNSKRSTVPFYKVAARFPRHS